MLLMIDNYCSFTYNIVQYFGQLQQSITVWRNNQTSLDAIQALNPQAIILGPGPCSPSQAGITLPILQTLSAHIPTLGICLGHQAIGQAFGGQVVQASQVMHGRLSKIHHNNDGVFQHLNNGFVATRYHSLVIDKNTLPDCLTMTAWTQHLDGSIEEIMGIQHKTLPIHGVQFHPESILSEHGHRLLNNFLSLYNLAKLDNAHLPQVA